MCGIAGLFTSHDGETINPAALDRMVDALAHRGPDDRGTWLGPGAAIGMRRLSIIDLAGGHQPMSDDDARVQVVYNGECYNHDDLRNQLQSLGHHFKTRCDTEVVLRGYLEWGIRGIAERLNGIYAFCIHDARARAAHLCRDRLGVKPLYYIDRNRRLAFSSEVRSLALSGLASPKIDEIALWGYLTYQFTPEDQTLAAGLRKLPPGCLMHWRDGKSTIEKYWDFTNSPENPSLDRRERTDALRDLLWDIVRRQMMSDVPIGCFLSGGLDSTIIACMMAKLSNHAVRTFSIAFPGMPHCDESDYFETIARQIGAQHQTIAFSEKSILDALDDFAWAMDEPVADPAMLPTYLLSREAARQVKVVLTGEGADEVLAGYPYYRPFRYGKAGALDTGVVSRAGALPSSARSPEDFLAWWDVSNALRQKLGRFIPAPLNNQLSPISNFPYAMDPRFLHNLLAPDRRPDPDRLAAFAPNIESRALAGLTNLSPLQSALALDTKLWLANDLMPKLDKMTMAHSLEGRVPFLDHRLVEFAFTLPASFKIGPDHGKMILRDAVRGIIPDSMLTRLKHGFNVPLYEWFRGSLKEFARDSILGGTLAKTGLFDRTALEALLISHTDLNHNMARPLWQLICLSRWYERYQPWAASAAPESFARESSAFSSPSLPSNRNRQSPVPHEPSSRAAAPRSIDEPLCDLLIPIYEGINFVRDLLRSIHRNTDVPYRIILFDDSANDAAFAALQRLAAGDPRIELHRNESNLGFVETCNRAIALARAPYVCLLNTDTLVSPGWLSRMIAAAQSDPRIAIVNPLSNKAVNISVYMPPGLNLNTMSAQLANLSRNNYPDITTAVGFCMLIKREHLDALGGFDAIYGRGYCEESDLCMRYTQAGLRVVAAEDAFVYHKGCGSFGTWMDRYLANRKIFDQRWEEAYLRDYRQFLKKNPLQSTRDALLRHTLARPDWSPATCIGLERFVRADRARLASKYADTNGGNIRSASESPNRPAWVRPPTSNALTRAMARPRTPFDPTHREVRYPTRPYVDGLPKAAGLRVTFLIAEQFPVCGGIISVVQLARELLLDGHDVKIATLAPETEPERLNLPCQPLVFPDRDELFRLFPPSDVVVATYWTTAADYLPELHNRYNFLSVYFVQDYEAFFFPEHDHATRERVMRTYALADRRIVKSRWLKALIEDRHAAPCEIVHLGLDLGIFRDRKQSNDLRSPPRLISVARPYDARRGFPHAAEVFRRIHAIRPDVEFVFFGTPDEKMPANLGFPYTNAAILEDQNHVAQLIGACDILLDSSLFQGFGRPGLEAMACGTACVLTSEGGVNEYARHEQNCLLVPPQDQDAMTAAILRLLDDAPLRGRLRENALRTAENFCHIDEAKQHLCLYRDWLEQKREFSAGRAAASLCLT